MDSGVEELTLLFLVVVDFTKWGDIDVDEFSSKPSLYLARWVFLWRGWEAYCFKLTYVKQYIIMSEKIP